MAAFCQRNETHHLGRVDTYCNANESATLTDTQIRLGWVIITARQNGTPLFFSRPDGSTRENFWGNNLIGPKGNDEFRNPEVVAVNKFRKEMNGEKEYIGTAADGSVVAIGRGDKGMAIVNLSQQGVALSIATKMADGTYTAELTFAGGSGKAYIQSPCTLTVADGKAVATVVWSSSKYDYMIVDGVKYEPVSDEGGSSFEIPVTALDVKIAVVADTVAMSTPHEIEYTILLDSSTLEELK